MPRNCVHARERAGPPTHKERENQRFPMTTQGPTTSLHPVTLIISHIFTQNNWCCLSASVMGCIELVILFPSGRTLES